MKDTCESTFVFVLYSVYRNWNQVQLIQNSQNGHCLSLLLKRACLNSLFYCLTSMNERTTCLSPEQLFQILCLGPDDKLAIQKVLLLLTIIMYLNYFNENYEQGIICYYKTNVLFAVCNTIGDSELVKCLQVTQTTSSALLCLD